MFVSTWNVSLHFSLFSLNKAMDKRMASRRQRKRNSKYMSDDFTSIFTDKKKVNIVYCYFLRMVKRRKLLSYVEGQT